MGTRGAVGFVIHGEEKLTYNGYDSYPNGLGIETLKFLREFPGGIDALIEQAQKLQVVSEDVPPTDAQIAELRKYSDASVSSGKLTEWYVLLRETQGDFAQILTCGYMIDHHNFPLDSLFCEWAYVIDLDAEVLEVYRGFQRKVPEAGRWAGRPTPEEDAENHKLHVAWARKEGRDPWLPEVSEYKAVALVASYPLSALPSDAEFVAALEGGNDADA